MENGTQKQRKLKITDVAAEASLPMPWDELPAPAEKKAEPPPPRPSPMEKAAREVLEAPLKAVPSVSHEEPIDRLIPSPFNPRSDFSKEELQELAGTFKTVGVLQPIIARPSVRYPEKLEIVSGERRWRAGKLAELATVPVLVRQLTDEEAKKLQLVENLQRKDLTVLELGAGYRELHEKHGRSVEQIAADVKKSRSSVYDAMQLLKLGAAGKAALANKSVTVSSALLVSYIPAGKRQDEALESVKGLTVEDAKAVLRSRFVLELKKAPFAAADAQLLPKAGPCTTCPKRSGAQPELFAGKDEKELCLDAECYRAKCDAVVERARAAHAAGKGPRVLSKKECESAFDTYGTVRGGDFKEPDAQCFHDEKGRTFRQLLGKHIEHQLVLAQHPVSGKLVELLDNAGLMDTVNVAGKIERREQEKRVEKKSKQPQALKRLLDGEDSPPEKTAEKGDELEEKIGEAMVGRLADAVAARAAQKKTDKAYWRWLVNFAVASDLPGACAEVERRGLTGPNVLTRWMDRATEAQVKGLFTSMLLFDGIYSSQAIDPADAKFLGIDQEKMAKEIEAELKPKGPQLPDGLISWKKTGPHFFGRGKASGRTYRVKQGKAAGVFAKRWNTDVWFDFEHGGEKADLGFHGAGGSGPYRTAREAIEQGEKMEKGMAAALERRKAKKKPKSQSNFRGCALIGCKRVAICKGYCKAHYQKLRSLERTGRRPHDWQDFPPPNSVTDIILPRRR